MPRSRRAPGCSRSTARVSTGPSSCRRSSDRRPSSATSCRPWPGPSGYAPEHRSWPAPETARARCSASTRAGPTDGLVGCGRGRLRPDRTRARRPIPGSSSPEAPSADTSWRRISRRQDRRSSGSAGSPAAHPTSSRSGGRRGRRRRRAPRAGVAGRGTRAVVGGAHRPHVRGTDARPHGRAPGARARGGRGVRRGPLPRPRRARRGRALTRGRRGVDAAVAAGAFRCREQARGRTHPRGGGVGRRRDRRRAARSARSWIPTGWTPSRRSRAAVRLRRRRVRRSPDAPRDGGARHRSAPIGGR